MLSTILSFFFVFGAFFLCSLLGGKAIWWLYCFMEMEQMPSFRDRNSIRRRIIRVLVYSIGGGMAYSIINRAIIMPWLHLSEWGSIRLFILVQCLIGFIAIKHWAQREIDRENESLLSRGRRDIPPDETAAEVAKRIVGNRTV